MWGIRVIHGEEKAAKLIDDFVNGNPPFLLSTAFPFLKKNNKKELFFPKPIIKPFHIKATPETMALFKDYKKVQWLPEEIFSCFVKGELSEKEFFKEAQWRRMDNPWGKTLQVMHNTIDRITNSSISLFYTQERFIQNGGLFFLLDIRNSELEDLFKGVFQFYEHVGFGGDSSIGKGTFKFEMEKFKPDWLNIAAKQIMTLSLYSPQKEELSYYYEHERDVWYRLELRRGKVGGRLHIQTNVWKKGVTVFTEGSVFPAVAQKEVYGVFPLVKEKKKAQSFNVYYNGYPLMINFNMKGN